ncbi:MAG: Holliday junction branch migration protein RuvA, partial [Calditrichaeota bacterium]
LELKDKYARTVETSRIKENIGAVSSLFDDAVLALASLGYSKANVIKTLDKIMKESAPDSMERMIKEALRRL